MATTQKDIVAKLTPAQARKKIEELEARVKLLEEDSSHCDMCDKTKKKEQWINVNKVDRKKRKNHVIINNASF